MAVQKVQLHSAHLLNPAAVFGGPGVDTGFVPASTAVTPAHHASQEDPPTGAGDGQRPTRVALREAEQRTDQEVCLTDG